MFLNTPKYSKCDIQVLYFGIKEGDCFGYFGGPGNSILLTIFFAGGRVPVSPCVMVLPPLAQQHPTKFYRWCCTHECVLEIDLGFGNGGSVLRRPLFDEAL